MKKLIPKLQTAWHPLVVQSDNTRVNRPMIIEPKKIAEVAAERAIKAREQRRKDSKYDEKKAKEYTQLQLAQSKPSTTETIAGAAADLIDGTMIGAPFSPQ